MKNSGNKKLFNGVPSLQGGDTIPV